MTEKFSCPEPSEEARRAYIDALNAEPGTLGSVLAAAYAVDVPRIVRAEVERALRKRQEDPLGFSIGTYLAARFGAAPESCGMCQTPGCRRCFPSVAAVLNERLEPRGWETTEVWLSREEVERRFGVKVTPDGQTQAERDFLRALAVREKLWPKSQEGLDAARRVVES